MKNYLRYLKGAILFIFLILSYFIIYNFFYYNQRHEWNSFTVNVSWMITILFFIIFFYTLLFLINFNFYIKIFNFLIPIGTLLWIGIYFLEFIKINLGLWNWNTIKNCAAILCMSILSPGLSLYIIKYIKNNSNPNRKWKIFKKNHVHEGFVGIIFVIFALFLWVIRLLMIQHEILKKRLRIFLAIEMILLYLFLFCGSFLIVRDRRDVVKLKFIEKRQNQIVNKISPIFNEISQDSLPFFKFSKVIYYPFGILLNSIALNMFIHGTDFLPDELFNLHDESIVLIGIILSFIAGGMIGLDWYRLFSRLYPQLYKELEKILDDLKKSSVV